jgi:predicted Zn-dependent protease
MAARSALLSVLAALLSALPACMQDDGARFNPIKDMTSVSEDEERELGLRFDQELRKHVVVIDDPIIADFINALGQEIVRGIEPQPFIYRFRVIQDPRLNAFAVPGGYVYFHSGTLLAVSDIDELAGVMGHEIAHVKAHHYARQRKKTQIPDLLVGLAGMAAAVVTKEPGILMASQAANVAVKLRFSREFENEADRLGSVFMTRAGYQPDGINDFFEKLVHEQERHPQQIPPYLYSHPDVEDRMASVEEQARSLRPTRAADPRLADELSDVQGRLAYLLATRRGSVPPPEPPEDPHAADPYLAQADRLAQEGQLDEALFALARGEAREPRDPRIPFRIGELLAARGRHRDAVAAYRRTIRIDPTHAMVFYKLGISHKALGERHSAVQSFEQASRRAGASSVLRERADWQIEILIFPVLLEVGTADADPEANATPLGRPQDSFGPDTRRMAWWARLHPRYDSYPERMRVRWIDPSGALVAETPVKSYKRRFVGSVLEVPEAAAAVGEWSAEASFEDEVLDRRSFRVQRSR